MAIGVGFEDRPDFLMGSEFEERIVIVQKGTAVDSDFVERLKFGLKAAKKPIEKKSNGHENILKINNGGGRDRNNRDGEEIPG